MQRFAVIGLGKFGTRLADLLAGAGAEVIALDRDRRLVEEIRDKVARAVCLDCTNEELLRAQGIDQVEVGVVAIGDAFEDAVLVTLTLKQMGVPCVVGRATSEIRAQVLSRIGADHVINPEKESAERWRNHLLAPSIIERVELAEGYSLAQVPAPPAFHGKTLADLDLRRKYQVNVVAIRHEMAPASSDFAAPKSRTMITMPMPDTMVQPHDVLLLVGSDEAMRSLPT